ncbi:hypothetical protein AB4Y44_21655 [Paraburkholderia sp. BR10937]|uniref:hypothetical protein n=1 Tax=Paraburkholderia sp. BR10937 TaxID=3236994 RepID=UPI0034D225FE
MMTSSTIRLLEAVAPVSVESTISHPQGKISANTYIARGTVFSHDIWSFHDTSLRGMLNHRGDVEINWREYRGDLRGSLILDLKALTYVCLKKSFVFATKRGVTPKTIVKEIKGLIGAMRKVLKLEHICYLSDVTALEWKSLLDSAKSKGLLCAILKKMAHPRTGEYLFGGEVSLKLETLRRAQSRRTTTNTTVGLPSELFGLLSNVSQRTVLVFLNLINEPVANPEAEKILPVDEAAPCTGTLLGALNSYETYARAVRAKKMSHGRRKTFNREFKSKFGMHPRVFVTYLRLVHGAALLFVALYTGMRVSELRLLRRSGLFFKDGRPFIRSTVSKHQPLANAVDCDQWVATDALVDAMKCLRILSSVTGTVFLARQPTTMLKGRRVKVSKPPNQVGVAGSVKAFFRSVVLSSPYSKWRLSLQQCREGLAEQMARMHVKMPYASIQLKHLAVTSQSALRGLPANITLRYGNYPRTLLSTVVGVDAVSRVKKEQVSSLYGAGSGFAGGGADKHREKVEAYFAGMGLEGKERDAFISKIAPHVSVYASGIGFCSLNLLNDRDSSAPPCLGDLQCNPFDCSNSVVPAYNRPAIEIRLQKCDDLLASGDFVDGQRLQRLSDAYSGMLKQLDEK